MLTKLGGGNTITHRWPLNTEHVHEIEEDMWDLEAGDAVVSWDFGAPATGYCWVLSSVTISFDVQPILTSIFFIDSLAGANDWFYAFVGQSPNPAIIAASTANVPPVKIKFDPAIKFPVNEDIALNWIGGDAAVMFFISPEVWQELESVSP